MTGNRIRWIARLMYRMLWQSRGRIGPKLTLDSTSPLSVVIATFREERAPNLQHLINNVLRCAFVDELVLSHHNPEWDITKWIEHDDVRLRVRREGRRTDCINRWKVARECKNDGVLVLDDDLFLFPWQIRGLYKALLADPDAPHGVAGEKGGRYVKDIDAQVDYLYEAYMVSKQHLNAFSDLEALVVRDIGEAALGGNDYVIISRSGLDGVRPRIHRVGRTLRCPTASDARLAVHKRDAWRSDKKKVARLVQVHLDSQQSEGSQRNNDCQEDTAKGPGCGS